MKLYEIAYIADPTLSPEEADSLHSEVTALINKAEGIIGKSGSPLKKSLAYSVKKHNQAYLCSLDFSVNEERIKEIEDGVKKEKSILRHLIVKKPEIKEKERTSEKKRSLKPEKAKLQEIDQKIEEII